MKKYKIIVLAMLACVSLKSWAQEEGKYHLGFKIAPPRASYIFKFEHFVFEIRRFIRVFRSITTST